MCEGYPVDSLGFFALPTLVVKKALARYGFHIIGRTEVCRPQFYAVTAERKLSHPAVMAMTVRAARSSLDSRGSRESLWHGATPVKQ